MEPHELSKQELNKRDPLKKQGERGSIGEDLSPIAPPEAYAPPGVDKVSPEEMHPLLRSFVDEHTQFKKELQIFEDAIMAVQSNGFTKELDQKIKHFFHFFDLDFVPHSRREERLLFPVLNERLIATGEHSKGHTITTSVDLMEDDHIKAIQLAALAFNFLGLAFRLPDDRSRLVMLDASLEQSKNLIELMRLHMFREDNVLFSSAHKLISKDEFDAIRHESGRIGTQ